MLDPEGGLACNAPFHFFHGTSRMPLSTIREQAIASWGRKLNALRLRGSHYLKIKEKSELQLAYELK